MNVLAYLDNNFQTKTTPGLDGGWKVDLGIVEPGIYKLYEPDEEILPSEGTIVILSADRSHSVAYGGKTDRVMIGVNFYSI